MLGRGNQFGGDALGLGEGGIFSLIGIIGFAFALKKVRSGGATVAPQVAPPTPPQP